MLSVLKLKEAQRAGLNCSQLKTSLFNASKAVELNFSHLLGETNFKEPTLRQTVIMQLLTLQLWLSNFRRASTLPEHSQKKEKKTSSA